MRVRAGEGLGLDLRQRLDQTCQRLNVGKTTVFALLKARHLRRVKIGRRSLIAETDICALIERELQAATARQEKSSGSGYRPTEADVQEEVAPSEG